MGADLAALCDEALLAAIRRMAGSQAATCSVTPDDFRVAELRVRPSALREAAVEVPQVSWDDVGGLAEVKAMLREAVELPFTHPTAMERLGASAPRGEQAWPCMAWQCLPGAFVGFSPFFILLAIRRSPAVWAAGLQ